MRRPSLLSQRAPRAVPPGNTVVPPAGSGDIHLHCPRPAPDSSGMHTWCSSAAARCRLSKCISVTWTEETPQEQEHEYSRGCLANRLTIAIEQARTSNLHEIADGAETTEARTDVAARRGRDHSSRKQGTVGRPSIPIHRPRIGFGNEVGFCMMRWRFIVPAACSSIQVPGSNSQKLRHNLLTPSFLFSRTPRSSSNPLIARDPLTARSADRQGFVVL